VTVVAVLLLALTFFEKISHFLFHDVTPPVNVPPGP
jgi:hypothetical protein